MRLIYVLLLFVLLMVLTVAASAQLNYSAKAYRSFNADSLTVQAETVGLELFYDNVGVMYFNTTSNKWRCYATGTGWYDCTGGGGGGGGTVTSVNVSGGTTGLTFSGGPVTTSGTITAAGTLAIANGGNGTATPSITAGSGISITGTWGGYTITNTGGGGGGPNFGLSTEIPFMNATNTDFNYESNFVYDSVANIQRVDYIDLGNNIYTSSDNSPTGARYSGLRFPITGTAATTTLESIMSAGAQNASVGLAVTATTTQASLTVSDGNEFTATQLGGRMQGTNNSDAISDQLIRAQNVALQGSQILVERTAITVTSLGNTQIDASSGGQFIVNANGGVDIEGTGGSVLLTSANAMTLDTGNGNDLNLNSDDDIILTPTQGLQILPGNGHNVQIALNSGVSTYLILTGLPTTCSGAPANSIAAIAGVLTLCP